MTANVIRSLTDKPVKKVFHFKNHCLKRGNANYLLSRSTFITGSSQSQSSLTFTVAAVFTDQDIRPEIRITESRSMCFTHRVATRPVFYPVRPTSRHNPGRGASYQVSSFYYPVLGVDGRNRAWNGNVWLYGIILHFRKG